MTFKKGVSGNPNGKPKGPNKITEEIKQMYVDLLERNLPKVQGALDLLYEKDPKAYVDALIKLSPFVIPKKVEQDISFESPINIILPEKD